MYHVVDIQIDYGCHHITIFFEFF
uniref:Uncharacterized protein n=1 Tax=Rhizophora mucronata TaxID=61149 RepID=A0A2P2NPB1_RHIMU